ncbi:hypothetical protein BB560_003936 [Smittium megazygosporum]|uniref:Adenylate kinase active site lid domain-containing protein n=1 Tax=Smittium megazygosporum TaxID=133381 RepID=A0A2T9ZAM6_9FUNG|nr:hypothetical protein BB560_003936 [Smittium megazygosporum]
MLLNYIRPRGSYAAPVTTRAFHASALRNSTRLEATARQPENFPETLISKTKTGVPFRSLILGAPGAGKDLVPDPVMIQIIKNELGVAADKNWLIDGFPRNISQAKALDQMLDALSNPLNAVMYIDVPFDLIVARITERYVHVPSGRVYNLTYNPPIVPFRDDVTGEPLVHRPDDNPETFKKRLQNYKELTLPLLEYYNDRKILYSFSGNTSDIIFPKVLNYFSSVFV